MRNSIRIRSSIFSRLFAIAAALCVLPAIAQQTLGGITGEVTDASGGVIPNVAVTALDEATSLTRTTTTNGSGTYALVNLPIGTYTLTYKADGYDLQKTQHITVQANRTATVNAALKVGQTTTTVEVEASPLMNAVDTTVGYVLDKTADRSSSAGDRQLYRIGYAVKRRQRRTWLAEPAQTPAWAMRPSGRTASATRRTAFC